MSRIGQVKMIKLENYTQFLGRNIRIVCKDGLTLEGKFFGYSFASASGEEDDDISIVSGGVLYGFYMHEVEQIAPLLQKED